MRTIPNISALLKPLDKNIDEFIKVLLNDHKFNHDDRLLYSLPAKKGGLELLFPQIFLTWNTLTPERSREHQQTKW